MGLVKYSYCLNENNELVHISSVSAKSRVRHTYYCIECGQQLIAKIGKIKVPHFAHRVDTTCDGESYLHKLAKRRIREKFMSASHFSLTFTRDVPCQEANRCHCYIETYCYKNKVRIPTDLKMWNEKIIYDKCEEEVKVGEFRPDLLLTCTMKPKREPVFIEIYKTHESEEPKVASKYRIIETIKIKSESDIDSIIERGFIEGENCKTYNFSPKLPLIKKKDVPITRFSLFENGAAKVIFATKGWVTCDKLNQKIFPNSIRELNFRGSELDICRFIEKKVSLDPYQAGLVYLVKKGLQIKNCNLCKFYKYNEFSNTHICIRYKTLGEQYHFPQQTTAKTCRLYQEDPILMKHSIEEFEKDISEVPI